MEIQDEHGGKKNDRREGGDLLDINVATVGPLAGSILYSHSQCKREQNKEEQGLGYDPRTRAQSGGNVRHSQWHYNDCAQRGQQHQTSSGGKVTAGGLHYNR